MYDPLAHHSSLISVMEGSTATNAVKWWNEAVGGLSNVMDRHVICLAAVESAFCVHALQSSGLGKVRTPGCSQPLQEWADEVEALVQRVMDLMQCGNYCYYKALLLSMLGRFMAADEAWTEYTSL